jgi:hypothetical protein
VAQILLANLRVGIDQAHQQVVAVAAIGGR